MNVPLMVTLTFGFGVGLAGLAGVLAAPIYSVSPDMGSNILIVVFAIVVIGGMGSIGGAILTGIGMGVIEGLTKYFYPEASTTVIFLVMVLVLLVNVPVVIVRLFVIVLFSLMVTFVLARLISTFHGTPGPLVPDAQVLSPLPTV